MDMCYDGALVMPSSYAVMDEEEMTYVEGGGARIAVTSGMLNKTTCQIMAGALIGSGQIKGMTGLEIAQELYAHAVAYYRAPLLLASGLINYWIYQELRARAGIVDLDDGGDTRPGFKAAYAVIWYGNF